MIKVSDSETYSEIGWKRDGRNTNALVKSEVTPVTSLRCEEFYRDQEFVNSMPNGITDNLFCAYSKKSKKMFKIARDLSDLIFVDVTINDGIVFVYSDGIFFIHAIASDVKNQHKRPGIYTRIANVAEWIENIIA